MNAGRPAGEAAASIAGGLAEGRGRPVTEQQALSALGKLRTLPDRLDAAADPLTIGSRAAAILGAIVAGCYASVADRNPAMGLPPLRRRRLDATRRILVGLADLTPMASETERPVIADMVRQVMTMQAKASLPAEPRETEGGSARREPTGLPGAVR